DNHPASGARLRSDFCHRGGRIAVGQARLPEPFMRPGEDPVSMTRQEQMVRREMETHIVGVPTEVTMRSSDEALVHVLESLADEIGGVRALVVGDRSGLPIV